SCCIHFALDVDRASELSGSARRPSKRLHAEVHGVEHPPVLRIDEAGDSDRDAAHIRECEARLCAELTDAVHGTGDNGIRSVAARATNSSDDLAGVRDRDSIRFRAPDIEADADGSDAGRLCPPHYETPSCPERTMTAAPRSTMSSWLVSRMTTSSKTPSSV